MRSRLLRARESFWFLPSVFGAVAVLLALALVGVDRYLVSIGGDSIPLLEDLSPAGARGVLSAIGGTMLGVAATSFSITISVLATTSSAYGPRLVRNFMADRGNQIVLAVLTSTFLYALVVLRSVHAEDDSRVAFVPIIAVSTSVLLAVADVAVLVYFIHHIAMSVQVTTLQDRVLADLEAAIDLIRPEQGDDADGDARSDAAGDARARRAVTHVVRASGTGYVSAIHLEGLVADAVSRGAVHRVVAVTGDHVVPGDPLVEVIGGGKTREDEAGERDDAVRAAFTTQSARTPHQDLRYAVQQVVEIGVRGLASGTNDPYTAVGALHALSGPLRALCLRPNPVTDVRRGEGGEPRVEIRWPAPEALIGNVFQAVRSYGTEHVLVMHATLDLADRLASVVDARVRAALRDDVRALEASYVRTDPEEIDAAPLRRRFAALDARLAPDVARP